MENELKRKKSPAMTLKVIIKNKAVEGNKATDVFVKGTLGTGQCFTPKKAGRFP